MDSFDALLSVLAACQFLLLSASVVTDITSDINTNNYANMLILMDILRPHDVSRHSAGLYVLPLSVYFSFFDTHAHASHRRPKTPLKSVAEVFS